MRDILSAELPVVLTARSPLLVSRLLLYSQDSDSLRASSFMLITVKSSLFLRMLTIDCEIYFFSCLYFFFDFTPCLCTVLPNTILKFTLIHNMQCFSPPLVMVSCKLTTDQNMASSWLIGHLHAWSNRYRPGLDTLSDRWAKIGYIIMMNEKISLGPGISY